MKPRTLSADPCEEDTLEDEQPRDDLDHQNRPPARIQHHQEDQHHEQ